MAITDKNQTSYLFSAVIGLVLTVIIIMPDNVFAQTLASIPKEKNMLGISIPFIKVGHDPRAIAVNPDTNKVYVANYASNTVSAIDITSMRVKDILVGISPVYLAMNRDTNTIYVANSHNESVSVIDGNTDTKIKDISVGKDPRMIAIDPFSKKIYVANARAVDIIDGNTNRWEGLLSLTRPEVAVRFIAVDPEGGQVAAATRDSVHLFNSTGYSIANTTGYVNGIAFVRTGKLYVVNLNDSVSVINSHFPFTTHSSPKIKNIALSDGSHGRYSLSVTRTDIAVNPNTEQTYLTNLYKNSVSVIDGNTDTKIKDIPVEAPTSLAVSTNTNRTYIVDHHYHSLNTDRKFNYLMEIGISVVDGKSNRLMETVQMGSELPSEELDEPIAINPNTNMVYVADAETNAIFVLDGSTNKPAAGITFNVIPANSGHITCNSMEFPTYQYLYVDFRTHCQGEPNKGFQFVSWVENLGQKSSRSENTSRISDSPWEALKISFLSIFGINPKDTSAIFTVTQFGNFTANFKEVPPPIPPEYLLALFGLSVSVIIPSVLRWINGWKQRRNLDDYIKRLPSKLNQNDAEKEIRDLYIKGKISESHLKILNEMIATKFKA